MGSEFKGLYDVESPGGIGENPFFDFRECSVQHGRSIRNQPISENWREGIPNLCESFTKEIRHSWEQGAEIASLKREVVKVKNRLDKLEHLIPLYIPVETLAPEPYEVIKSFHVVIEPQDDLFLSGFFDANISACGDTRTEALDNLKDVIVATFEVLTGHKEDELGPGPARQLKVLKEFIRKKA